MAFVNRLWKVETEGWNYVYASDRVNGRLTDQPCVYCIVELTNHFTGECEIVYVGKTYKQSSRLKYPHPIERKCNGVVLIYYQLSDDVDQHEIDFIKRYKPKFNIRHNVKRSTI